MEYLGIGLIAVALRFWGNNTQLLDTPDSRVYGDMCRGVPVRNPYRLRWLLPLLLDRNSWHWWIISSTALILTCPLMALFAEAHGVPGLWAVLFWVSLPLWDILARVEKLVDPVAWVFALLAAVLALNGYLLYAVAASVIAGCIAPKAPVFAALWILNPWLLLGLVPVVAGHFILPKGVLPRKDNTSVWITGMKLHGPRLHNARAVLLPWGGCMAAVLCGDWRLLPAVAVAYAQLLFSTDSARLFMWCAPVVIVGALKVLTGESVLLIALLITWFNPFRMES